MRQALLVFLISFQFSASIFSQNASIEGFIKDNDSKPLPGISVYLEGMKIGTSTNGSGYFVLKDIQSGNYTLVFSGIGFKTLTQPISIEEGQKLNLEQSLEESISELSEVVISGGSTGIKDIPGSVQYITPKELDQFSYTDINRALKSVPGINIQEEDGFGLRPNIGLRATGVERSSKISLMEDGILMAPAPYVAPAAYYFPTMGRMQGIEVMKGHAQIKYGPYTTGGALNLISSQIPDQLAGRMNLLYGSYETHSMHLNFGNSHKNVGYVLETFQYGSNGFKELDGGGNTGFNKKDYLGKVRFNTNESAKVYQSATIKFGMTEENGRETYLGLTDDDFQENPNRRYISSEMDEINTEHKQISLTHNAIFNERFKVTTSIYRNDFKRNWYKLDKVVDTSGNAISISKILEDPEEYERAYGIIKGSNTTEDERLLQKANNRSYYAQGIQTALKFNYKREKAEHNFELGLRYHEDQVDRFQWVDEYIMQDYSMTLYSEGIPGTESNRIEWANAFATYGQYNVKIGKTQISPGIRYEHIELTKFDYGKNDVERTAVNLKEHKNVVDVILPGLGLDYKFNKFNSIFAGYHRGFAPPGTKEGTLPEESNNYELGYRYTKNTFSVHSVVFYNDYENLLGVDLNAAGGVGSNDLFNGGKARSQGLELQLKYDLLSSKPSRKLSLPFTLTYTYTDAIFLSSFASSFDGWGDVEKGDQLPYLANNQVALSIGAEYKRLALIVSGRYMDAMRTEPGQGDIIKEQSTDSYFVTDISMNFLIRRNISFFASTNNITDEVYIVARRPAGVRPGMPRSFNFGLKASF